MFKLLLKAYAKEISLLKWYIISIPIVITGSYLFYNIAGPKTIILWGKEDSFFEWLTAVFYLVGSVLLVLTFKRNRNLWLLLLAIILFFGAGEEASWGQRVFHFSTPDAIKKVNVQGEFNIHNIDIFNHEKLNGKEANGFARFLEMDFLFKIFTMAFGILLPFCVYHFKFISSVIQKLKIPVPPISIGIFFFISWVCLKISFSRVPLEADMVQYWKVIMAGPEIAEFVGSYIMALITIYFFKRKDLPIMGMDFKQTL